MEEFNCHRLFHSVIFNDMVKKLTTTDILHDEVQLFWSLNNFVQLDNIGMPDHLKNMDFSSHSLNVINVLNLVLFQDLDCHFLLSHVMNT